MRKGQGGRFGDSWKLALVIGGLILGTVFVMNQSRTAEISGLPPAGELSASSGGVQQAADTSRLEQAALCAGDPNPTLKTFATNTLITTSINYVDGSLVHFRSLKNPLTQIDFTLAGSTKQSSTSGKCDESYDVVVETLQDKYNGAYFSTPIKLNSGGKEEALKLQNMSNLAARVKDRYNDAYMYDRDDAETVTFENLGAVGSVLNFTSTTGNTTQTTINADENQKADFQIEVQAQNPYGQFGMKTYLGIDWKDETDTNDWQTPDVTMNGVPLTSVIGTLDQDDLTAFIAYDGVYNLGKAIGGSTVDVITSKFKTGAGINPNRHLKYRFIASAVKESVKTVDTYLGLTKDRFFDDSATNAEIATSTVQGLQIEIA